MDRTDQPHCIREKTSVPSKERLEADRNPMETRKTLLLIDEAHDDRRLLAIRLEALGFNVTEADNPSQVQRLLGLGKMDWVVTEWGLPGWPGVSLIPTLAPSQRPVVIFTDALIPNVPFFLGRTGVKAVISKKRRSELLNLIQRADSPDPALPAPFVAFGKHILLVEDSATVRHFMRRAIEEENPDWKVSEAGEAVQALVEATHQPLDLMVLDLEMPGMDGPAWVRVLREKPSLRYKPVLALAACGRRDLKEAFQNDPYVTLLPKPVTAGQIVETIQSIIGEKQVVAGA